MHGVAMGNVSQDTDNIKVISRINFEKCGGSQPTIRITTQTVWIKAIKSTRES